MQSHVLNQKGLLGFRDLVIRVIANEILSPPKLSFWLHFWPQSVQKLRISVIDWPLSSLLCRVLCPDGFTICDQPTTAENHTVRRNQERLCTAISHAIILLILFVSFSYFACQNLSFQLNARMILRAFHSISGVSGDTFGIAFQPKDNTFSVWVDARDAYSPAHTIAQCSRTVASSSNKMRTEIPQVAFLHIHFGFATQH